MEIKTGDDTAYSVREHSHNELSIGFVEEGSSLISCKNLKFELDVNSAMVFPPDTIHLCEPEDKTRFRFLMIYIDSQWFVSEFGFDASSIAPEAITLTSMQAGLKDRFVCEFEEFDDPFSGISKAISFIGAVLFEMFGIEEPCVPPSENTGDLYAVKTFMDENFMAPLGLDELASRHGTNKYSFLRHFKNRYRLTPHAYLLNLRINKARQLLLENQSVAHTAAECGFFDQSHFVKVFRQYVGMSPVDYKSP